MSNSFFYFDVKLMGCSMKFVRRLPSFLYTWSVILLAYWFVSYLFPMLDLDLTRDMVLLLVLAILAEWFTVSFPQGQLSATFAVIFSSYLIFGPAGAVWITALGSLFGQGISYNSWSNPLRTILFNASQYVLAIVGADFIYMTLGGSQIERLAWENILPLVGFVLTCFLLNQLFIYLYLLPERKNHPLVLWPDTIRWDGFTYLLTIPFGVLMALIYFNSGLWGVVLLFLPVLVMQFVLRLYVHLELANRELRAFSEVANYLGKKMDPVEIMELVLEETRRVVRYHTGIIYLYSSEKDCFKAAVVHGPYKEQLKNSMVFIGQGFLGCAAENSEPVIIYDSRRDPRVNTQHGVPQVHRSLLVIPLLVDTSVYGLFVLADKRPLAFQESHLHTFSRIAGQTAVAVANAKLKSDIDKLSASDKLTGLYNRSFFFEHLERNYSVEMLDEKPVSIIIAGVNNMRKFNQYYGYDAGDKMLSFIAETISAIVNPGTLVARYGGGEFVVLLAGDGENQAAKVASDISRAVRSSVLEIGDFQCTVRVSVGLACYPQDARDISGVLLKAEEALALARESAHVSVVIFSQRDQLNLANLSGGGYL